jgi:hypothetical protein
MKMTFKTLYSGKHVFLFKKYILWPETVVVVTAKFVIALIENGAFLNTPAYLVTAVACARSKMFIKSTPSLTSF